MFTGAKKVARAAAVAVAVTGFVVIAPTGIAFADDHKNNSSNTATNITLFDEPGRSGSDAAQGVSNSSADASGCVDIPRGGQASSVSASGSYTLWSGADCTGDSVRLDGNVEDLGDKDFDDTARSVRLASPMHTLPID